MTQKRITSLIALCLSLCMLLTGCGVFSREDSTLPMPKIPSSLSSSEESSSAEETPAEETIPEYIPDNRDWLEKRQELLDSWDSFEDLTYVRPDMEAMTLRARELTEMAETADNADAFFAEYEAYADEYDRISTMYALAGLNYSLDVTDEEMNAEEEWLSEQGTVLTNELGYLFTAIFENPVLEAWCEENWTPSTVEYARTVMSLTKTGMEELEKEETALVLEYQSLNSTFTVSVGGEDWTLSDFYAYDGTGVSYWEFYDGYSRYESEFNEKAGEIFIRLRDIRLEMAEMSGFDSYPDYMYANYGADYTAEDVQKLCDTVKEKIVPVYIELYREVANSPESTRLYNKTYRAEDVFSSMEEIFSGMDGRLADSLDLMLSRNLYDVEPVANKEAGAYTTFLSAYAAPFLFASFTGDFNDVTTLIHEFGHFNSYARVEPCRLEEIDSIDLAEIDSQGLELLMIPYYDQLFGEDVADAAAGEELLNALTSLICGCMEDEFQRTVYANPDMTLAEINQTYARLLEEYGQDETYGTDSTYWSLIHHHFSSPMYYISYALSVIPALELWAESEEDWDTAMEHYLDFIDERGHGSTFREALEQFGFCDPFDDSEEVLGMITRELQKNY